MALPVEILARTRYGVWADRIAMTLLLVAGAVMIARRVRQVYSADDDVTRRSGNMPQPQAEMLGLQREPEAAIGERGRRGVHERQQLDR